MRPLAPPPPARQAGFSMLEILITIVVMSIGLLGLAGLQTKMVNVEMEAYQRSHALILVQDMVDRITANRKAAESSDIYTMEVGNGKSGGCPGSDTAGRDKCDWHNALLGASTKDGSLSVGAMLGAIGCVEVESAGPPKVLRVTVAWQGLSDTVAPANNCGRGSFDSDLSRRTVSILVTLPDAAGVAL